MRRVLPMLVCLAAAAACASAPTLDAASPEVTQRPTIGLALKPPTYPPEAVKGGLSGDAGLRMCVSASGAPERIELIASSGHESLDLATLEWARSSLRFSPARANGRTVRVCNHELSWSWRIENARAGDAMAPGS
jgi:protein TonB